MTIRFNVNNDFMIYCIIVLSLLIILSLLVAFRKESEYPEFMSISDLAQNVRVIERTGRGVSTLRLKNTLIYQYRLILKKLSKGKELYSFEKWLADNHYKLLATLAECQRAHFYRLPHSFSVPRIIIIARFAVNRGYDTSIQNLMDFLKEVQKSVDLDYSELSNFRNAVCFAELEKAVKCARYSITLHKIELMAKKSKTVTKGSDEFLFFYSKYHTLPDGFLGATNEANIDFFDTLISYELTMKRAVTIIDGANTLSGKAVLPFYSIIDKTFTSIKGYENVSIVTKCAMMRKVCALSNKLNAPELAIAEAAVYLSNLTNKDISIIIYDRKYLKNYIKNGRIKGEGKSIKTYIYVSLVLLLSLVCLLPLAISTDIYTIFFIPMLFLLVLKPLEFVMKRLFSYTPRLPNFACGYKVLPEGAETIVVVSQFVNSAEKMAESYNKLLTLSKNCLDEKVTYVLLVDFPSYVDKPLDEEKEIVDYIKNLSICDRLVILVRKRIFEDGAFVPYERKRGAILDLFGSIINNNYDKFEIVKGKLNKANFAILLDDDSALLPETIINSINTMLHPYNEKYDLMTYGTKINKHSIKTEYSLRFSEDGSIDHYPAYSDIYSDVFDLALYCGKGIVRIKNYYEKLAEYFPDKRILSHDLIEGAVLRSGSLKQCVYEDAPQNFKGDSARSARWQKGDVLLLPYVGAKVKNKHNKKISNNINPLYKLILFINATNGVRDFFFILSVFLGIVSGHFYFCLVAVTLLVIPYVLNLFGAFLQLFKNIRLRYVLRDMFRIFAHLMERIFFLPFYAVQGIWIYLVTTFKSAVGKKSLLTWQPFFMSQKKSGFFAYSRLFLPSKLFVSSLALISGNPYFVAYAGLFVFYAFIVYKGKYLENKYDYDENISIKEIANKTYTYFDTAMKNGLPIDNVQYYPIVKGTNMSSPTDMGFAILNEIAAVELGIITSNVAEKKIITILKNMKKLKRYKGHFYNWYNVESYEAMYPYSISTADSANLNASLYCLISYANNRGNDELAKLARELNEADYSFLLDEDKDLLYISFYPNEKRGEGHYDLYESEARLSYYIAISRGIAVSTWFNLSRNYIGYKGNTVLSWYGSVFEYMMPSIFLDSPRFTMQEMTEKNVCKIHSLNSYKGCFGVSESGYKELNEDFHYKYKPNGLKTLAESLEQSEYVYSPYSCILCLPYSKGEVGASLAEYVKNGLLSQNGFYEGLSEKGVVFMSMTHHQGMIMCQIANRLSNQVFHRLFMQNAELNASNLLLTEPYIRTRATIKKTLPYFIPKTKSNVIEMNNELYQVGVLVGDDYSIAYSSTGSNRTVFKGVDLSPFYGVGYEGKLTYIKNEEHDEYGLIYSHETKGYYCNNYISFINNAQKVEETIKLTPNGKGEIRRLKFLEVNMFYSIIHTFDVLLAGLNEMYSHKCFYEMFVKTQIVDDTALFWVKDKVIGIRVLGLDKANINTNRLNVRRRNSNKPCEFKNEYPIDGEVLYPCYAVSGEFFAELNHNSIYFVQMQGDSKQECLKMLARFTYEMVDESFDLYNYDKNKNIKVDKSQIDLVGVALLTSIPQKELAKRIAVDTVTIKITDKPTDEIIKSLVVACKSLKAMNQNVNVVIDKNFEYQSLTTALEENHIPYRSDDVAITCYWGKELKRPKIVKYGYLNKPVLDFDGISVGEGKFIENGYLIEPKNKATKKPYTNVLASSKAGVIVSDNGVCFSWLNNSREQKVTVWRNDEIKDIPSEDVLLWVDNRLFSLTSCFNSRCIYQENKALYISHYKSLEFVVTVYIGKNEKSIIKNVKIRGKYEKSFSIVYTFNVCLGWKPSKTVYVEKAVKGKICLINKSNQFRCSFTSSEATPFIGREEFYNELRIKRSEKISINKDKSTTYDNTHIDSMADFIGFIDDFEPYSKRNESFVLTGVSQNDDIMEDGDIGSIKIKTTNDYLDILFNNWLIKQVRDCRMRARTSFYQCGGAFGFRDQLQDCLALLYAYPDMVKNHILLCASHQYEEGDVMHWWHMPKTGIRTRNSDDRLFLCLLTVRYINRTGDKSILNRKLPFLYSKPLSENELSRFETPTIKRSSEPLIEHLKRAIFSAIKFGTHQLLLVGSGDWNDGLDKIGIKGKGESVWLTMFAYMVLRECIDLFEGKERITIVEYIEKLKKGINNAFVIDRFLAYITDDGEILGVEKSEFCKLYLPVQAFAVLSGAVEPHIYNTALDTALSLVDYTNCIVKIFEPPFDNTDKYGYIGNYPKGVRENGGQYTHAAVWLAKALFEAGRADEGYEILCMLNPIERCKKGETTRYEGEPYVLSADVYSGEYSGRAGWSWYTGSASWYYETIVESMFGIKFIMGNIYFEPKLPKRLVNPELRLTIDKTTYIITFIKSDKKMIIVNGIEQYNNYISPLPNKGKIFVKVHYQEHLV